MQSTSFEQSPSNHLPPNPQLKCGESHISPDAPIDNDIDFHQHVQSYIFHVTLPPHTLPHKRLEFYSRERSSGTGVLHPHRDDETTSLDTVYDLPMDPHFFERGFYLEAKTGFQVWPGSRLLLEALLCHPVGESSFPRVRYWQNRLLRRASPLGILEVGSGIGVVGTALAAAGGHVLATDLPVLVHHGTHPNLIRNRNKTGSNEDHVVVIGGEEGTPSSFLTALHPFEDGELRPLAVGRGYARPAVLDWFRPVHEQLAPSVVCEIDLVVACDCIFLEKIVDPLLDTLGQVFRCCNGEKERKNDATTCLFTYQRRNLRGVFISLEELLRRIQGRGWSVRCLAWRKVLVEEDGEHDLFLFEMCSSAEGLGSQESEVPCEEKKE